MLFAPGIPSVSDLFFPGSFPLFSDLRTYPTFLRFWTLGLIRPFLPEPSSEHSLGVLWPLLTSRILRHPSRNVLSLRRRDLDARPPQVLTKSFTACSRHIYTRTIRAVWDLIHSWGLVHVLTPTMWFLFIDSRFCLLLPSDPSSRTTPWTWLTVPTVEPVRDFHPIDSVHAGRTTNSGLRARLFLIGRCLHYPSESVTPRQPF